MQGEKSPLQNKDPFHRLLVTLAIKRFILQNKSLQYPAHNSQDVAISELQIREGIEGNSKKS